MGASPSPSSPLRYERFGNFVLLTETDRSFLATEHRAAHLGEAGFDRLVHLVRFAPAATPGKPDVLVEHVKGAMKAGGAGVLKPLGTGRTGTGWMSFEHHSGRSLRAVLARGRAEVFPLALDNALEIARQICLTLEKVHGKKATPALVHGFLSPWSVMVSYDGAVRLRGFGLWASGALDRLPAEDAAAVAPEQREGRADQRTDVYGLAALILECLTGDTVPGGGDLRPRVAEARTPEGDPLPDPLAATLTRALAPRPEERHPSLAELRKEIEALLFAGDVAPTTFNLAFYMETLFRGTVEEDARAIDEETHADYAAYTKSAAEATPLPMAAVPVPAPPPATIVAMPAPPAPPPPVAAAPAVAAALPLVPPPPPRPVVEHVEPPPVERAVSAPRTAAPRDAAPSGSKTPLIAGGAAVLVLLGVGAFFFLRQRSAPVSTQPATTTLSVEAQAAVARVQELEARLKALEEERVQAEAAAAETAKSRLQAEAKAKGQVVDPKALERAQEEAAKKVRMQEEKRQQDERKRLEQQKRDEEARLAAAVTTTTVAPEPVAPPPTQAAVQAPPPTQVAAALPAPAPEPAAAASASLPAPGGIYDYNAPGVVPPSLVSQEPLEYPMVARIGKIKGAVTVSAIVDEQGRVKNARATSGNPVLQKAAVDNISARKYRPATKDGAPVKVQIIVQVNFKG
ncbi:MAG: TonB family protein [Vicinamibacteria bacterium]